MKLLTFAIFILFSTCLFAFHKPTSINEYPIHEDGGLIYNPLYLEAKSTGQLDKYKNAETSSHTTNLGRYTLKVEVPKNATAYDVVPIKYNLTWNNEDGKFPVAVQATAFEEESRRKGRDLFDLALPGNVNLDVEYLGSITAYLKPENKNYLKPDMTDKPGIYPAFERQPFVKSGVIEAGDIIWFQFRITNTGNTILDPEGIGGYQYYPELHKKNEKGEYEIYGYPYNLYYRNLDYFYPGESHDIWIHFAKWPYDMNAPMEPGEYLIKLKATYRSFKNNLLYENIWDGPPLFIYEMPIIVEDTARQESVSDGKVTLTDDNDPDKITRWIHTHEEFMSAFDCHIKEPTNSNKEINGTLYLQVAPWTEQIVIKLISTSPVDISTISVPIDIESDSLEIIFNPNHEMTIVKDGLKEPCIWSQSMADMRANIQL
ncbi:MAG: hypothetical protein SNJ70_00660 [Armatimonadota bacterium]